MADTNKNNGGIPGYGQPPDDVRTTHPGLPDQQNAWNAESEGKPRQEEQQGSQGQNVGEGPDVPTPSRTPVEGP